MHCSRWFRHLFLFLLLSWAGGALRGQSPFFSFGKLTTEQGLSQDHVTSIAQDRAGFIWLGTNDGLTRFDGQQCVVFRHQADDTTSLPDNRITGLTVDTAGRLWISTFQGMGYFHPDTRRFHRVRTGLRQEGPDVYVSNLAFDAAGVGWAVADSLLMRFDARTRETAFFPIPCRTKTESQVFADSKGRVWITFLGQHLLRFDRQKQQVEYVRGVNKPNGEPRPWPMWIQEDRNGVVWNSDWDQCFYTYDEARQAFVNLPDSSGIATVFLFEERPDKPPVLWAGGGNHGLWRMDGETFQRQEFPPNARDPFAHNNTRVHALYRDPQTGILWIGTELGVEFYDPHGIKFGRVLLPERLGQNQFYAVSGVLPDPDVPHRYWVSVWGVGLFEWQRNTGAFRLYDANRGEVFSNEIFGMARDEQGYLWYATFKGVERFDPRTRQRRHFLQPAPWNTDGDKALCVTIGPDGRIWSANNRGKIVETDPKTGKTRGILLYQHDGSQFPFYQPWNISTDHQGRVLLGSPNGLLRYNPATDTNDHLLYRTPALHVSCAVSGPDRRLYVGTTSGLYVLDERDSVQAVWTTENGLRNQNIRKLDTDAQGNIWIATANGLHRLDPRTRRLDYFSKADGLFVSDLSGGFQALPNGEVFVSGDYSFNLTRTSDIFGAAHPPRLALNGVSVSNRKSAWQPGQPLILRPGESVVAFDIAVIHFTQPEKTVVAYRLMGFNENWTETRQRAITYTNLDGGQYTLQVRARNGDGVWSTDVLEIPFRVVPPFYVTWWFRIAVLLLLAVLTAGVSRYRRQVRLNMEAMQARSKELEKQKLLNEIALLKTQVNPHFLFNSLSILSSLVHVNADLSEQFIDQLSRSYRYILEQKDYTLVTLRTELEFIRSYAFLLKIRFEHKFDLRVHLDEAILDQYHVAPLTLQLLVENAVKHNRMSVKEPLVVDVFAEGETLVVKNALRLRTTPEPSTGTGLQNIISRYALLTDRSVWAGETADACFEVRVPLLQGAVVHQ